MGVNHGRYRRVWRGVLYAQDANKTQWPHPVAIDVRADCVLAGASVYQDWFPQDVCSMYSQIVGYASLGFCSFPWPICTSKQAGIYFLNVPGEPLD